MITHKAFYEHINRIFTKASLSRAMGKIEEALATLEYAVQEIEIHARHTITKPPQLLRIERDIFREAYELQKKVLAG